MATPLMNPATQSQTSVLATNKVIRNTYTLLSMTLLFSAVTAGISMALNLPHPGLLLTLVGYFGLLFATAKFRNSALGLLFVFALTGLDQIMRPFTDRDNAFAAAGIPSAVLSGLPEPKEGECKDEALE